MTDRLEALGERVHTLTARGAEYRAPMEFPAHASNDTQADETDNPVPHPVAGVSAAGKSGGVRGVTRRAQNDRSMARIGDQSCDDPDRLLFRVGVHVRSDPIRPADHLRGARRVNDRQECLAHAVRMV